MRKLLALAFMLSTTLFITSCGDDDGDDDPTPSGDVTISGIPATAEIENEGTLGPVTATVEADAGLASLTITKDGAAYDEVTFTDAPPSADYDFTYTAVAEDADQNLVFEFTAEDVNGETETATHVLSVGEAPVFEVPVREVYNDISGEVTWYADSIYELGGRITVLEDATLNIEPGTVIKGQPGAGTNATALLIARGGTLNAVGTAELPIIFTALVDDITPADVAAGNYASPNLAPDVDGLWGGVIVLGNAQISASNEAEEDITETQIEGIPTSDTNGLYGGDDDGDSSGEIAYISIRHGGANIGAGNEINGLTLGGVGSGTSISNVEVVANQDDGIEWFGGSVDINGIVIWNSGDDGLDSDQDWIGTASDFIIVTPRGGSAFELDGPEGNLNRGNHQFDNGVVYAGEDIDHLVDWDGSTNAGLSNIYFYGLAADYGFIQDEDPDEEGDQNFYPIESFGGDGSGTNENWEYTLPADAQPVEEIFYEVPEAALTEVAENANTVGPNASEFGWTWAASSGALSGIGL